MHAILETLQWLPRNFHELQNKSVELQTLPNRIVLIWKQSHLKLKAFIGKNVLSLHQLSIPLLTITGRGTGTAQNPAPCMSTQATI